jgi:hypothetical protein
VKLKGSGLSHGSNHVTVKGAVRITLFMMLEEYGIISQAGINVT